MRGEHEQSLIARGIYDDGELCVRQLHDLVERFTVPAYYFGYYELGDWALGIVPWHVGSLTGLEAEVAHNASALIIGSLIIAIPVTVAGYFLFLYVWRRFDLHMPLRAEAPPDQD
jgi:hypothetical protein